MSLFIRGAVWSAALLVLLAAASCAGQSAGLQNDRLALSTAAGPSKATAHARDCSKSTGKSKHHVECKSSKHHHECNAGHGPKRSWKPKCRCKCGGGSGGAYNQPPVASVAVATLNGSDFQFAPTGSYDPDGTLVKYEWDWDSDGVYDAVSVTDGAAAHFFAGGAHTITLRVTDNRGATATFDLTANFPPTASIAIATANGSDFQFSGSDSTDPEGGIFRYEWDFDGDGIFEELTSATRGRSATISAVATTRSACA